MTRTKSPSNLFVAQSTPNVIEFVIIKATRLYCAAWRKIFLWQETHPHKDSYKSVITHIHVESWTFFLKLDGKKIVSRCSFFQRLQTKKPKMMKTKRTQWRMSGMTG